MAEKDIGFDGEEIIEDDVSEIEEELSHHEEN